MLKFMFLPELLTIQSTFKLSDNFVTFIKSNSKYLLCLEWTITGLQCLDRLDDNGTDSVSLEDTLMAKLR